MTAIRLDIVDLILDCDNFGAEEYAARQLRHLDGRPFTAAEHALAGQAGQAEMAAVLQYAQTVLDVERDQADAWLAVLDMAGQYFDRFGDITLGDVRELMPAEERARFDEALSQVGFDRAEPWSAS